MDDALLFLFYAGTVQRSTNATNSIFIALLCAETLRSGHVVALHRSFFFGALNTCVSHIFCDNTVV